MLFVSYLSVLAVIASSVSGTTYNVTNAIQDYYLLSQRQFQNEIDMATMQIRSIEDRGTDHIKVIKEQHQVILQEIQRTRQSFIPLLSLSQLRKHCIQKYMHLLISKDAVESQFTSCVNTAQSRVSSMTNLAWNSVRFVKETVNTNLPKWIQACNTTANFNNQSKMEECVLYNVDQASKNVQYHTKSISDSLEASLCTATDISRQAVQCTFLGERSALLNIGMVLGLIDNCVKEPQPVCQCTNNLSSTLIDSRTPVRNLIMGENY